MESLLAVVEDAAGDWERADAAERRVIEELRQMGNEALTTWAERGVEKSIVGAQAEPDGQPGGKSPGQGGPGVRGAFGRWGRGKRPAVGAVCGESRVWTGESPARGRGWRVLDCEPGGMAIWSAGQLLGGFLPSL